MTHPFVDLRLQSRLSSRSSIANDVKQLGIEVQRNLVGFLVVIGHRWLGNQDIMRAEPFLERSDWI